MKVGDRSLHHLVRKGGVGRYPIIFIQVYHLLFLNVIVFWGLADQLLLEALGVQHLLLEVALTSWQDI